MTAEQVLKSLPEQIDSLKKLKLEFEIVITKQTQEIEHLEVEHNLKIHRPNRDLVKATVERLEKQQGQPPNAKGNHMTIVENARKLAAEREKLCELDSKIDPIERKQTEIKEKIQLNTLRIKETDETLNNFQSQVNKLFCGFARSHDSDFIFILNKYNELKTQHGEEAVREITVMLDEIRLLRWKASYTPGLILEVRKKDEAIWGFLCKFAPAQPAHRDEVEGQSYALKRQ